jgi:hypothetical protein
LDPDPKLEALDAGQDPKLKILVSGADLEFSVLDPHLDPELEISDPDPELEDTINKNRENKFFFLQKNDGKLHIKYHLLKIGFLNFSHCHLLTLV